MTKEEFRKNAKIRLKNKVKISAKSSHYRMFKPLLKLLSELNGKKILIFNPLSYEPNFYLLKRTLAKKYEIFIPFMLGISLEMVKSKLPLVNSKFGVREPVNAKIFKKRVDIAVVPVLGVDGNMARIGHGKGFYDRFFDSLPYRPVVIFVCISDSFTSKVITQTHDISCDFFITPNKIYLKRGKYDRDFDRLRRRCGGSWSRVCSR